MRIEIGVKNGRRWLAVNGCADSDSLCTAAKTITGITDWTPGVLSVENNIGMAYGDAWKSFDFSKLSLYERGKERENLLERIKMVKEWISSIDYCVNFEILDTSVEDNARP